MPGGSPLLRRLLRRRTAAASMVVLAVVLAAALLAPWAAPFDPNRMDIVHRLAAPSGRHPFGTDDFGRDVLSRILYGARLSVATGALVVTVSTVVGCVLGLAAGSIRRLDDVLSRITDALMAFPDILLAIALMAALGPSLVDVVAALGTVYTPRVARLVRGATLVLSRMQFIEAAEALGAGEMRIVRTHLLPNLVSPLIVQATFIFAAAVLTEAALSFLGAGIPPTVPSWGNMIAGAQQYIDQAQWLILAPGIAIVLTVLSLQVLGDALRDALDPRLRRLT
jgi:peptide/nickel transport system permease protein